LRTRLKRTDFADIVRFDNFIAVCLWFVILRNVISGY